MCKLLCVLAILLAAVFYQVNAQVSYERGCRTVPVVKNFTLSRFLGLWYEQSRHPYLNDTGLDCVEVVYTPITNNAENFHMDYAGKLPNGTWNLLNATAYSMQLPRGSFDIYFSYIMLPEYLQLNGRRIQVVHTDYVTHAILWSCVAAPDSLPSALRSNEFLWILTRDPEPSAKVNFAVQQFASFISQTHTVRPTIQHSDRCGAVQIYAGILLALIMSMIVQFIK